MLPDRQKTQASKMLDVLSDLSLSWWATISGGCNSTRVRWSPLVRSGPCQSSRDALKSKACFIFLFPGRSSRQATLTLWYQMMTAHSPVALETCDWSCTGQKSKSTQTYPSKTKDRQPTVSALWYVDYCAPEPNRHRHLTCSLWLVLSSSFHCSTLHSPWSNVSVCMRIISCQARSLEASPREENSTFFFLSSLLFSPHPSIRSFACPAAWCSLHLIII